MSEHCANCNRWIAPGETDGESQVYSPDQSFVLCEPCWLDEEDDVNARGTNDIPERIERYQRNARAA